MQHSQVCDMHWLGAMGKRLIIGVPTTGCRWWRKGQGCIHCSVGSVLALHGAVRSPLEHVCHELDHWSEYAFQCVCLYTPGSALDTMEIDTSELASIVAMIEDKVAPKRLVIESRPELVVNENLIKIVRASNRMSIEVLVPLESANPTTRGKIGKLFDNRTFIEAAKIVKQCGCLFSTTVLLKPPGLSEGEAIADGCKSVEWLRKLEPYRVVVEPMAVHDNTPLAVSYRKGLYKPPWLWSVHAVMASAEGMRIEMGGEFHYPVPIAVSSNCGTCSLRIEAALRKGGAQDEELNSVLCRCRGHWMKEVEG